MIDENDIRYRLSDYRNYSRELNMLKIRIQELERIITNVRSTSILGMPDEGGVKKYLQDSISELEDLRLEYDRRYKIGLVKLLEVKDIIDTLDDSLERTILFIYYCGDEKKSLFRIAKELHYSHDYIRKKHGKAITTLEKNVKKKWCRN